jgi:hypothetical protein
MENIMKLNSEYNQAYIETKNIIINCINNPEEIDTDEILTPQRKLPALPNKSQSVLYKLIDLSKINDEINLIKCKEYLAGISRLEIECLLRYLQISSIVKETLCDFSLEAEDEDSEVISRLNEIAKCVEIIFNTK